MEVSDHMVENWVGSVSDSPFCALNLGDMVLYWMVRGDFAWGSWGNSSVASSYGNHNKPEEADW